MGMVAFLVKILAQLGLKSLDLVLKLDDIIPVDFTAFGGVEIFANGTRSFTR